MTSDERDRFVAGEIKKGVCPFGEWEKGDPGGLGICHLGVPGCGCADEFMLNPYLQDPSDHGPEPVYAAKEECQDDEPLPF